MAKKPPERIDPEWAIREGAAILRPLMSKHWFRFELCAKGGSSGGSFAAGEFRGWNRRLEFHFRYSLGLVRFHMGKASLSHEEYLRGLNVWGRNHYPGFTDDPLEPFRQLLSDLQEFGGDFLAGRRDHFMRLAAQAESSSQDALDS